MKHTVWANSFNPDGSLRKIEFSGSVDLLFPLPRIVVSDVSLVKHHQVTNLLVSCPTQIRAPLAL